MIKYYCIMFFILTGVVFSATYTVEPGGIYPTIQSAIDAANHGDEIIVKPGNYPEILEMNGKNVTLHSEDPTSATIIANTKIDGHVIFRGDELTTSVLSGFYITGEVAGKRCRTTIKNNSIHGWWGVVDCDGLIENNIINSVQKGLYDCDGIIRNNTITNALLFGLHLCDGVIEGNLIAGNKDGGLVSCQALIQNNVITENITEGDNGAGLFNCDGVIRNNIITFNSAIEDVWGTGWGGAFYGCDGEISNNLIQDNVAECGGGLTNCNATIKNNRIVNNHYNAFMECVSGSFYNNVITERIRWVTDLHNSKLINNTIYGDPNYEYGDEIRNNILRRNDSFHVGIDYSTDVNFNCLSEDYPGYGNINTEPMFNDVSKYDFRLKAGSPCIDAGDPAPEYNDACSPPGLGGIRNDMGAYGGPGNNGWPLVVDDYWIKNFILKAYYPSDDFKLKLDINSDSIIDSSDIIEYVNQPKKEE